MCQQGILMNHVHLTFFHERNILSSSTINSILKSMLVRTSSKNTTKSKSKAFFIRQTTEHDTASQTTKSSMPHEQTHIATWIKNQQWDELRSKLETALENTNTGDALHTRNENQTLVLACKFDAPSDIINKIVQINAELTQERDEDSHQTPLHILCQKPASQDRTKAIKILTERCPQAAIIMNLNGNTPLHELCKKTCNSAYAVSAFESVSLAGPAAMTMENHDDETPMEIFLLSQGDNVAFFEEEYQNQALKVLSRTNIMYLSNFKSNSRGEMYRLQCCQQAMYKKSASFDSCATVASTDDESETGTL